MRRMTGMYTGQTSFLIALYLFAGCGLDTQMTAADMGTPVPDMTSLVSISEDCKALVSSVLLGCRTNPASSDKENCSAPASLFTQCRLLCGSGMSCEAGEDPPRISGMYKEPGGSTRLLYLSKPPVISIRDGKDGPIHETQVAGNKMTQAFTIYYATRTKSAQHLDYQLTAITGRTDGKCPAESITKMQGRTLSLRLPDSSGIPADVLQSPIPGSIMNVQYPEWERQRDSGFDPPCP